MQTGRTYLAMPLLMLGLCCAVRAADKTASAEISVIEISREMLEDKIRGGLVAQLLGNLNGLPHENKYYEQPGSVEDYKPALPEGARTDDDTDIEWVYIAAMQRTSTISLLPAQISELWKRHINGHIWCANQYARHLMDMGIEPPLTGNSAFNPWANFNISGQFICESFGLIAPGMPQTAARIGLHYTHVAIDGEPAQATQFFAAMIATAFITDDLGRIIDAGLASIDPNSILVQIVRDVRGWHAANRQDWRKTRQLIRDRYTLHKERMRNQNGYELCTAATVAALLYGKGDLAETLRYAFNFGWDADNNAATAGTVVGVIRGWNWIQQQGWVIKDIYTNTTRTAMPKDETITSFGDRLIDVAKRVIIENGGEKSSQEGKTLYRIRVQKAANVERLINPQDNVANLRSQLKSQIDAGLAQGASPREQAKAAYLAICLGDADSIRAGQPENWTKSIAALKVREKLLSFLFYDSPGPAAETLQNALLAAGIAKPTKPD